jgi:hypothetical protein
MQGLYLHTGQHKHRKTWTHIHASSRIRNHDPSVRAAEDSMCLDHSAIGTGKINSDYALWPFPIQNSTSETYEYVWTVGMTPWTGDRPVARPLPTQGSTTQKNANTNPCLERDSNL